MTTTTSRSTTGSFCASAELTAKLNLARPLLDGELSRLWGSSALEQVYPRYLRTMYSVIQATVPMLRDALDQVTLLAASDPSGPMTVYREYLGRHLQEETNHDEWCLNDLEVLGYAREDVRNALPSAAVAEHVGAQLFLIRFSHPVALLGHMAVMEGAPPTEALLDQLAARTGFRAAAFGCVRHHAIADPEHVREVLEVIDGLGLDSRLRSLVSLSALETVRTMAAIVAEVRSGDVAGA